MSEFSDDTIRKGVADWFNREGPLNTTLEELTRYAISVTNAPTADVSRWLTTRCPECSFSVKEMGAEQKEQHLIVCGSILVCCEWYWVVSPVAVGMPAGQWDDWTQYHEDLDHWKRHGE